MRNSLHAPEKVGFQSGSFPAWLDESGITCPSPNSSDGRSRGVLTRHGTFAAFAVGVALLVGCASSDRGFVQREWSMSLRELGIVPVFPPREDLVVGDIYVYDYDPESERSRKIFETSWDRLTPAEQSERLRFGMNSRLARLDFGGKLSDEYEKTLAAPATPSDYNMILGNPALAAANTTLSKTQNALVAVQGEIDTKKTEAEQSGEDLTKAKRDKEDAESHVASAKSKLDQAKANPVDASAEEARVEQAETNVINAEDALREANRKLTDDPNNQSLKDAVRDSTRDKEDADTELARSKTALQKKKAESPDVSQDQQNYDDAKATLATKTVELRDAERGKADADAAYSRIQEIKKDALAKAQRDVESAKAVRDAIAIAGVKELYPQPRDKKYDVFDVSDLPNSDASDDDLVNARINRLRLVGFPQFTTVSFTQGDLAALIPIEALQVGLNISSNTVDRVSVNVPAAESYALSVMEVYPFLKNPGTNKLRTDLYYAALFQTGAQFRSDAKKPNMYVRVVTEVYYARALDVSLFSSRSFGTRAQVSPLAAPDSPDTQDAGGAPKSTHVPVDNSAVGSTTATSALSSLESRLGMSLTAPGGSVQFLGYSEQSIGLRRVFDRPVAIGIRGLTLEVKKADATIVSAGTFRSSIPTAAPR